MSLAATESPFPIPRRLALALAALGPVAIGAIFAAKAGAAAPLAVAPAIVFGVLAATSPALYIAIEGERPLVGGPARRLVAAPHPGPGRPGGQLLTAARDAWDRPAADRSPARSEGCCCVSRESAIECWWKKAKVRPVRDQLRLPLLLPSS
jgi:hypothetical protein